MIDFNDFCSEIFQILRAYGRDMVLYDESGNRVYEPTEARRMYVTGDNILVSISEDGDNSAMNLYLSPSMNLSQVKGFIETLRTMASKANLLFRVKKFDKEIKPQDFATKASVNEQENLNMNLLEGMYGTSKSSYLKLESARMIVRHSERVKENVIGGRGRNIDKIYVENASGERFLFPVNMLSGARAMTQHVNQGGTFADDVGQQIIRMAKDFRDLARVAQHVQTNRSALPENATGLRESVLETMKGMKLSFNRIYEGRSYARETQQIVEAGQLNEDGEQIAEKMTALKDLLGESLEESVLLTVARKVAIPEAQEPVIEEMEVAEVVAEDDMADDEAVETMDGDVEEEVGDEVEMPAPDNSIIKEFDSWMEDFDPETMLSAPEADSEEVASAEECEMVGEAEGAVYTLLDPDLAPFFEGHEDVYQEFLEMFDRESLTAEEAVARANQLMKDHQVGIEFLDVDFAADPSYMSWTFKQVPVEGGDEMQEEEQLDELRVKNQAEPEMSVHDIKSTIAAFKAKADKLSPFDPEYLNARHKIDQLTKELAKATPYGKTVHEETQVDEAFAAELERLMKLAGRK